MKATQSLYSINPVQASTRPEAEGVNVGVLCFVLRDERRFKALFADPTSRRVKERAWVGALDEGSVLPVPSALSGIGLSRWARGDALRGFISQEAGALYSSNLVHRLSGDLDADLVVCSNELVGESSPHIEGGGGPRRPTWRNIKSNLQHNVHWNMSAWFRRAVGALKREGPAFLIQFLSSLLVWRASVRPLTDRVIFWAAFSINRRP